MKPCKQLSDFERTLRGSLRGAVQRRGELVRPGAEGQHQEVQRRRRGRAHLAPGLLQGAFFAAIFSLCFSL